MKMQFVVHGSILLISIFFIKIAIFLFKIKDQDKLPTFIKRQLCIFEKYAKVLIINVVDKKLFI